MSSATLHKEDKMASKLKPLCKFGDKCYRKNSQHLKDFQHPKRKNEEDEDSEKPSKKAKPEEKRQKKGTLDDFFGKKQATESKNVEQEDKSNKDEDEDETLDNSEETSSREEPGSSNAESDDGEDADIEPPASPEDVKENIKQKFLVDMPDDFYQFWDFCKTLKPEKPTDALMKLLGYQLVGPFDILAGNHKGVKKNSRGKLPNFLTHWRYYYDPPEFQTVVRGDDKTQFHLGYFRDDPQELPVFVGSNSAATDCIISPKGDNLFSAISACIDEQLKHKDTDSSVKTKLKELSEKIKNYAEKNGQNLELKSKKMKDRDKKVVCKSFHKAGIVVPVDENEVGYREVPETPAHLKQMFKKIVDSKSDSERDKNYEDLQELITLVQFANDECDYGEGLELGMDLFCYGGKVFHSTVMQLLPLAYMLLRRNEFGTITEAHLKNRRHDADLSQL